jgi:hypothetical protein
MNCYEIWTDLAPGVNDLEFVRHVESYMESLRASGQMEGFRIRRRKLGFGPGELGEWNITMEFRDLRQLEDAFDRVAQRSGETERLHHEVYSRVRNLKFALYRDYPGEERDN